MGCEGGGDIGGERKRGVGKRKGGARGEGEKGGEGAALLALLILVFGRTIRALIPGLLSLPGKEQTEQLIRRG